MHLTEDLYYPNKAVSWAHMQCSVLWEGKNTSPTAKSPFSTLGTTKDRHLKYKPES